MEYAAAWKHNLCRGRCQIGDNGENSSIRLHHPVHTLSSWKVFWRRSSDKARILGIAATSNTARAPFAVTPFTDGMLWNRLI